MFKFAVLAVSVNRARGNTVQYSTVSGPSQPKNCIVEYCMSTSTVRISLSHLSPKVLNTMYCQWTASRDVLLQVNSCPGSTTVVPQSIRIPAPAPTGTKKKKTTAASVTPNVHFEKKKKKGGS